LDMLRFGRIDDVQRETTARAITAVEDVGG
jgi:hypothetical protein